MLKLLISKKEFDELPEAIREHYSLVDGSDTDYTLDSDDSEHKRRISEFRNNNVRLTQEKAELQEQMKAFKDVDPAKYREYEQRIQEIEDKDLINAGDLDALVEKRTERMRSEYEGQIKKLSENLETLSTDRSIIENRLSTVVIDSEVQQSVSEIGAVRQGAMKDVLARAREVFLLKEGEVTPVGSDGNVLYGTDGKNPLTISEWCNGLLDEAPYLFEGSSGGESRGDGKSGKRDGTTGRTLSANDADAISGSIEDIASGKVKVEAAPQ